MKKIIIIGSGFGGLALGIRLQTSGFEVILLEKNKHIGGHAYSLERKGYRFDMGPSLITAPGILQDLFRCCGKDLFQEINCKRLDPCYRIYFHDGSHLDYTGDSEKMKSQMAAFHQGDAAHYDRFLEASKKIHDVVIEQRKGGQPFMTPFSMLRFAPDAIRMNALISTYWFARHYFKDPRHRFLFSFHPLFIGGNPFRAPSIYEMIPYLEKTGGVWYSFGGMTSLVKTMGRLFEEAGGRILCNQEAEKILIKNRKAEGVRTRDTEYTADAVVSNADFIHTCRDLIAPEHRRKWTDRRLQRLRYSMSAFMLYLGVKRQFPRLLHHTLILSHRYRELIRDIFDRHVLPDDFSAYLHVPTRTEPAMAPQGCESMYVLIPVTNLQGSVDWEKQKTAYAEHILNFLEQSFGLEDLKANLEVMEIFTPEDFRNKQNAAWGSAWGVEPCLTQTAYFRPHNRSEDIGHLYLVGASTHPGAGLPGCLMTAETTAAVMLKDFS